MATATQPFDGNYPDHESWQTLVGDQRYRLFAAGNRRAAIAECLPGQSRAVNAGDPPRALESFDARYGIKCEAQRRLVLLTEVSRVPDESQRKAGSQDADPGHDRWRWEATRRVQPIWQLKSYIDEQEASCVFFLTRSRQSIGGAAAAKTRERLVDSAVRIGRSLGLDSKNLEALRVAGMVHEMGKHSLQKATGEKFYLSADDTKDESERCHKPECENVATARLADGALCTQHFITTCYERLDGCADQLSQRAVTEQESEKLWSFLIGCIEQAGSLTKDPFHQEPLERARLLDILHTATELSRHMRRSARLVEAIPVRLLCETPGRPWQEQLKTKLISQYGAMVECEHIVRPGDWLYVERMDTGSRTRARLAWRGSVAAGRLPVALEFLDAENFWEMSWPGNAQRAKANGASAGA